MNEIIEYRKEFDFEYIDLIECTNRSIPNSCNPSSFQTEIVLPSLGIDHVLKFAYDDKTREIKLGEVSHRELRDKNLFIDMKVFEKSENKVITAFHGRIENLSCKLVKKSYKIQCRFTFVLLNERNEDLLMIERIRVHFKFASLISDLEDLLQSGKFSDVMLKSTNGEHIPAHKNILSIRSPVFSRMFEIDMLEKQTNMVNVDMESSVLKAFLQYIYTGILDANFVDDLVAAADLYQIDCLKRACEKIILQKAGNIDTVVKLLKCANIYNLKILKDHCTRFIAQNLVQLVTRQDFKELVEESPPDLLLPIFDEIADVMKRLKLKY